MANALKSENRESEGGAIGIRTLRRKKKPKKPFTGTSQMYLYIPTVLTDLKVSEGMSFSFVKPFKLTWRIRS